MVGLFLIFLIPIIILIGVFLLIDHGLKTKYKPDEILLENMKEFKSVKILDIIDRVMLFVFCILPKEGELIIISKFLFIMCFIVYVIIIYIKLKYLGNVDEYKNTRKYILSELYMSIIIYILSTSIIMILK